MEKVFGEYLIKCKVNSPPEVEENKEEEKADPDADPVEQPPFYPYEQISVEEALVRTTTSHVVVLYTAEYCPPCEGLL